MSMTEIIIIAIVALLVLGPKELPRVAKTLGKTMRDLRRAGDDIRTTVEREIMKAGEEPAPRPKPPPESVARVPVPSTPPAPLPPAEAALAAAAGLSPVTSLPERDAAPKEPTSAATPVAPAESPKGAA
jgi:sec-independent protein translocase protein TatB